MGGILGFTCGLMASMVPCVMAFVDLGGGAPSGGGSSGPMRPQPAAASVTIAASVMRRLRVKDGPMANKSELPMAAALYRNDALDGRCYNDPKAFHDAQFGVRDRSGMCVLSIPVRALQGRISRSSNRSSWKAPPSRSARIAGARRAVIQSIAAGLISSSRRAWVIMPRSPTNATRVKRSSTVAAPMRPLSY